MKEKHIERCRRANVYNVHAFKRCSLQENQQKNLEFIIFRIYANDDGS